jgi:ribosomal protein L11 methyltransferase
MHYALRVYGFREDTVHQIERVLVENTDWLAEWKKHWKPTHVGSFVIAPPWGEVDEADKIVIRIEPNMAFGTGTHETTQLCLRSIAEHYSPGDSFLDVGTGTGILAIAAAKMNPKSQISNFKSQISNFKSQISDLKSEISNFGLAACDTDADAVSLAMENANLNGVGEMIDFRVGPLGDDGAVFDFVCANLTLDVILPILPRLLAKANKTLVLSGILCEQKGEIAKALEGSGFEISEAGEWLSVVVETRGGSPQ